MGVTDLLLKAKIAPNFFGGQAIKWWKGRRAVYNEDELTWVEFRKIFLDKYVSVIYRNKMKVEFMKLVQGTNSMFVYVQKFE